MCYVLVLPFPLSVNSSAYIRTSIQGSRSSLKQQLNLSQFTAQHPTPSACSASLCRGQRGQLLPWLLSQGRLVWP